MAKKSEFGNSYKAKEYVTIHGKVTVDGASNLEQLEVVFPTYGHKFEIAHVEPDGRYSKRVNIKGTTELVVFDAGFGPNYTRADGVRADLPFRESMPEKVKIKSNKKKSYRVDFSLPSSPDPITSLPIPVSPAAGTVHEDNGIIELSTPRDGIIGQPGETDWYRVGLREGSEYLFSTTEFRVGYDSSTPQFYPISPSDVSLYNSSGQLLFGPGTVFQDWWTAPESGTYFLAVEPLNLALPLTYHLTVM
jgi:hypothetical protein